MALHSIILKCLLLIFSSVYCKTGQERFIDGSQGYAELLNVISTLQTEVAELKISQNKLVALEAEFKSLKTNTLSGGVTYVQWGRTSCTNNGTELIYKGFMAGAKYSETGGGANNLCLPEDPTFSGHVDGHHGGAHIYGTEIEVDNHVSRVLFGQVTFDQNIPCATCRSPRVSHIMIPARTNCYAGWTQEYKGFLIAAYPTQNKADYVCLDAGLEFVPNGTANDDDHRMRPVEVQCGVHGSLPCPPYSNGRELLSAQSRMDLRY